MALPEKDLIHLYENVQALTQEMLLAAQVENWEEFHHLGRKCAQEVDALKSVDAVAKLSGQLLNRKFELIQNILGTDRAIRRITEPWMRQLEMLMKNNSATMKLEFAYNSGAY